MRCATHCVLLLALAAGCATKPSAGTKQPVCNETAQPAAASADPPVASSEQGSDAGSSEHDLDADGSAVPGAKPKSAERGVVVEGDASSQSESLSATEAERLRAHCVEGAPAVLANFGKTQLVVREGYSLRHSEALKIPLWVCEEVTHWDTEGSATRKVSKFAADPKLHPEARAELKDYKNSGYDRGHNAPAADFKFSQPETNDSFFLSNMTPQVGVGFNRAIWADLEEQVRRYARGWGQVWVITGSYIHGHGEYQVIGPDQVAIPTHFYKVVVRREDKGYRIATFVMENRPHTKQERAASWSDYLVTLDELEAATKIDFLPELSAAEAERFETTKADLTRW